MTCDDLCEHVAQIGLRIDAVHFASFDERGNDRPMLAATVGASEEMVLAAERHHPFILPMSVRSWKSITGGIPILAARSACDEWSSGRRAASLRCRDRRVS
jgi:hypothetical protein